MNLDEFTIKVRVIPPVTIDDSVLISSTAPEPGAGEVAWNSGTTYAAGAEVILTSTHRKYLSLQGSNTDKNPATETTYWEDNGPTNKYAMVDLLTNEATVLASPLTFTLLPGRRINSLGLSGLVGAQVEVWQFRGTTITFHEAINLNSRVVTDWTSFFFEPFSNKKAISRFNIPPFTDAELLISITGPSTVECGAVVIGTNVEVGVCERQARVSGINFSNVARDFAGGINTMTQRRSVPKISMHILMEKERVNRVLPLKDDLNAVPAFWTGIDDDAHGYYEALQAVSFYRTFDLDLSDNEFAFLDLELEAI